MANMSMMGEESSSGYEEYDDDVFYLELRRRILLLVADDDEEDLLEKNYEQSYDGCTTSFPTANHHPGICQMSCWESENRSQVPSCRLVNLWRNGNPGSGTGVFIPQAVKSRRRHRSGRKSKSGRRMDKQVEK